MGYSANPGVIGSVLGLVLTGCLFAVQGFVSTGIEYDTVGWFNFLENAIKIGISRL